MISTPAPQRPDFPRGYGISTAAEGLLDYAIVRDQLTAAKNYWVVTASQQGRPHAAPVWGLWMDETFAFSSDPTARKVRNLTSRPEVVVHLESGDDTVIVEGSAERLTDRPALLQFVAAYKAKYDIEIDTDDPEYGVYIVRPHTIFAWREKDFPQSATRWRLS